MIVAAVLWEGTPFYTMNFLAGLAVIPAELYEAAKIDGANAIQCFFHVTLPGLSNVIIITTCSPRSGPPPSCSGCLS